MSGHRGIETRVVTWTVSRSIGCGHHECCVCGESTPRPTEDEIVRFIEENDGDNFMWPGDDWMPKGWELESEGGLLCPVCVKVKRKAFEARRKVRGA